MTKTKGRGRTMVDGVRLKKQRCVDCHFLMKTWRDRSMPQPVIFSLTAEERRTAAEPDLTFKAGYTL